MTPIENIISIINDYYPPVVASVGKMAARTYEFLQNNPKSATATIFTINALFITVIFSVPNWINQDRNKKNPNLDANELKPRHAILGILTGGATYLFNIGLTRATGYKMSQYTQIFLSIISMIRVHSRLQGSAIANDAKAAKKEKEKSENLGHQPEKNSAKEI